MGAASLTCAVHAILSLLIVSIAEEDIKAFRLFVKVNYFPDSSSSLIGACQAASLSSFSLLTLPNSSRHYDSPLIRLNNHFPDHPGHSTNRYQVVDWEMKLLQQHQGHHCGNDRKQVDDLIQ
jgi:hypothetical protein